MNAPRPNNARRVIVAGGSLGGLGAGLALLRAGFDVEVFERSPVRMGERGAGLVVQPEALRFMEGYTGTGREAFSVRSEERQYLTLRKCFYAGSSSIRGETRKFSATRSPARTEKSKRESAD